MIKVKHEHLEKLKKLVEADHPYVICGAIIGYAEDGEVIIDSLLELENEHCENRETRYLITPQQYLKAEEAARTAGFEIVGFYHSRQQKREPGGFDIKHALPGIIYITISGKGDNIKTAGWKLADNRKSFIPLQFQLLTEDENVLSHKLAIAV